MYTNKEFLDFFYESKKNALDMVVASVIQTQGSTYSKTGNIIIINSNLEFVGVLGSPYLHKQIFDLAKEALETKSVKSLYSIPKDNDSGHGTSEIQIKPFFYNEDYTNLKELIKTPYNVLIFGSGTHVSSMISMANLMGWETTVIDVKIEEKNVKQAHSIIELKNSEEIFHMDLSKYQAAVILSHSPKTDDIYLKALIKTEMEYIGMMGNKKNMRRKKEQFNLENDKRFFAPIGFDIGSYTHQSIALSICSQIEARKNKKI